MPSSKCPNSVVLFKLKSGYIIFRESAIMYTTQFIKKFDKVLITLESVKEKNNYKNIEGLAVR